jgi:hypothetical protein
MYSLVYIIFCNLYTFIIIITIFFNINHTFLSMNVFQLVYIYFSCMLILTIPTYFYSCMSVFIKIKVSLNLFILHINFIYVQDVKYPANKMYSR